MKFDEFSLSNTLLDTINELGYTEPTEIQALSIPHILKGKDVIGESATGSGKTLAFGTGFESAVQPKAGLQAVILTPTRELAEQVRVELKTLWKRKNLKVISIYGGVGINPQIQDLKTAEVVVGTPGRMLDHLQRKTINMSKVRFLVLDEADRMLDMGFIDDVEKIVKACPKERQTLFFSATLPSIITKLAGRHMKSPIRVSAKKQVDPSKLRQVYYDCMPNHKISLLIHLLNQESSGLVMVFCNTRRTTDFVVKNLKKNKIDATGIHGGLTQNKRSRTLSSFNTGKVSVMVCTDVAARGLHIENVSHIYNYEIPQDPTDYVHRIGRTARAGEKGKVVNLLCSHDFENFDRVKRDYREFIIAKQDKVEFKKIHVQRPNERKGRSQPRYGLKARSRSPRRGFRT